MEQDSWQPAEQHWHVSDAVFWIVYRTEPNAAPETIIPDVGNGRMTSKTLMAALRARAVRDPRSWPPMVGPVPSPGYPRDDDEAPIPAYRVRFIVKRWMREERLDAVGLFAKASADLEKYHADMLAAGEQQALFSAARRALNAAARNGLITVLARPSNTWDRRDSLAERVPVRPTVFDEHRGVDASGSIRVGGESGFNFLRDAGPFFHDAIVIIDEVKRLWQPPSAAAVAIAAEQQLQQWLEALMRATPEVPPGKEVVRKMATDAGYSAKGRPFTRAWDAAVRATNATAWAKSGPKSKR